MKGYEMKNSFGLFGKGYDGYAHYSEEYVDKKKKGGGGGDGQNSGGGTFLRCVVAIAVVLFVFWIID